MKKFHGHNFVLALKNTTMTTPTKPQLRLSIDTDIPKTISKSLVRKQLRNRNHGKKQARHNVSAKAQGEFKAGLVMKQLIWKPRSKTIIFGRRTKSLSKTKEPKKLQEVLCEWRNKLSNFLRVHRGGLDRGTLPCWLHSRKHGWEEHANKNLYFPSNAYRTHQTKNGSEQNENL